MAVGVSSVKIVIDNILVCPVEVVFYLQHASSTGIEQEHCHTEAYIHLFCSCLSCHWYRGVDRVLQLSGMVHSQLTVLKGLLLCSSQLSPARPAPEVSLTVLCFLLIPRQHSVAVLTPGAVLPSAAVEA